MNNIMEKKATGASARNIIIKTQQGKMEITVTSHNQPGVCPHCHRAIPLSSSSLPKIDANKKTA